MNKTALFILSIMTITAFLNRKQLIDAGTRLTGKWTRLNPVVQNKAIAVLNAAESVFKDTGYTVHIFDGWRSQEQQSKYIKGGTSFITSPLNSYHPWGLAVDFVFKDPLGMWTWSPGDDCAWYDLTCKSSKWYWAELGKLIEAAGFEWGGRWETFDGPHAQYVGEGRTKDLIAKHGSPDALRWT